MKQSLQQLARAMNELMEKFDWHDTTEEEDNFLINVTNDLIELLHEHDIRLEIDKA